MKYSLLSFSFRGMSPGDGSRLTWIGCLCVELPWDMSHPLRRNEEKEASEKGGAGTGWNGREMARMGSADPGRTLDKI